MSPTPRLPSFSASLAARSSMAVYTPPVTFSSYAAVQFAHRSTSALGSKTLAIVVVTSTFAVGTST